MTSSPAYRTPNEHVLPEPGAPVGPDRPFVGNETVEDNLTEAIQIAAWKAIGSAKCGIDFELEGHTVTMRGELDTEQRRKALEQAIFGIPGIQIVLNKVSLAATGSSTSQDHATSFETVHVAPSTIAYATRFCSFDEASLSAAIRDAVAALDLAFDSQGLPASRELVIVYRNDRYGTVTLQVGMPSQQFAAIGEFHVGPAPAGRMAVAGIDADVQAIQTARATLLGAIAESGETAADYYWKRFDEGAFRPWNGHPAAQIFVPLMGPVAV